MVVLRLGWVLERPSSPATCLPGDPPISPPQKIFWLPTCKTSQNQTVKWHLQFKKLGFYVHFFLPPFSCSPESFPPLKTQSSSPLSERSTPGALWPQGFCNICVCALCWVMNCVCPVAVSIVSNGYFTCFDYLALHCYVQAPELVSGCCQQVPHWDLCGLLQHSA